MNAAELLVKCLENEGVKFIFGMAGEENLHFVHALSKSKSINYVAVRHEQSAGFMAATVGRLTGKAGVALTTLGPGATNLVTAAAYAKLGAMPMFMITGQKPLRDNPQGNFQIIDIVEIMRHLTKKTTRIANGDKVAALVRESIRQAEEERPGPVHLEIPKDVLLDQVDKEPLEFDPQVRRPIAEYKAITKAIDLIKNAKHPILLIGAGANRKLTSKMLTEFVNNTGIPFVATQMGKGVIDERNKNYVGTAALTAGDYVHCALDRADLIINVGHDIIEKSPFLMRKSDKRKVIHINYFSAEVYDYYFPDLEVIGDIANTIWQIGEELKNSNPTWDFEYFEKIKKLVDEKIYAKKIQDEEEKGIKPQNIVRAVREFMGDQDILALDNGMYKLWFARYYKTHDRNTLLLDNALATMGAGLPSGIAAKLLNPDKKVLVVAGDGGFMMNSQELETAIRLNLDLVVLLINDSGLGMIKWEQDEKNYTKFGLDHKNPDFVKYAESYGAKGFKVKTLDQLLPKLKEAYSNGGVNVIDCDVDYSENINVFTHEKEHIVCPT